jgi:hypothetical protein
MSTAHARSGFCKAHANIHERAYECAEALIHGPVHMFRAHLLTTSTACMLDAREQVCAVLLEKERRRLQSAAAEPDREQRGIVCARQDGLATQLSARS